LRRSAGDSATSNAHTTSPSRKSQPVRTDGEATGSPLVVRYNLVLMSKRTVKRKLRTKRKANHGKKPNCGRG
jgi:hypothetical protein